MNSGALCLFCVAGIHCDFWRISELILVHVEQTVVVSCLCH